MPVEHQADRNEEEHRKGILQREGLLRRTVRKAALLHHHAGQERTQREAHVENCARTVSNDNGGAEHREGKELSRSRAGNFPEHQRQKLSSHHHHEGDEDCRPGKRLHDVEKNAQQRNRLIAVNGRSKGRQTDKEDDGNQVLHHQPSERRLPVHFVRELAKFKRLRDHHGRSAGDGKAEKYGRTEIPVPESHRHAGGERRRNHHLRRRARYGHALHAHQVVHGKIQTDPEHEEHDADFGKLLNHLRIDGRQSRKDARRKTRENVPDKRRSTEKLFGNVTERKRQPKAGDQAGNQGIIVHFARSRRILLFDSGSLALYPTVCDKEFQSLFTSCLRHNQKSAALMHPSAALY